MNEKKLLVTDLDGTLLRSDKSVSAYSHDVFARTRAAGHIIAYATARPVHVIRALPYLPAWDYVIADNGATIADRESILSMQAMPRSISDALIAAILEMPEITCTTVETGEKQYTDYTGEPWGVGWHPIVWDFRTPIDAPIAKFSVECTKPAIVAALVGMHPELHLYSNRGEDWYQIMLRTATKANGVRDVAKLVGIPISQVIAFGDDENDIDMLRASGRGVAMENAIDAVKAAADDVCLSNDEDGVARWIERALLGDEYRQVDEPV